MAPNPLGNSLAFAKALAEGATDIDVEGMIEGSAL